MTDKPLPYRFFAAADAAQDRIWTYTLATWGEGQALRYLQGLHDHLTTLCQTPSLWRRLPDQAGFGQDPGQQVFFSRYDQHYVFFRRLRNGDLGVMSILHVRTDLPARLAEELGR